MKTRCAAAGSIRKRMTFTGTIQAIRDMSDMYPQTHRKLIEDKANGSAAIDALRREISGLIPVNPHGGKEARASAVSAAVESGNVFLPRFAPWLGDFIEECAAFPNAAHDDQVDAMTQALMSLHKMSNPIGLIGQGGIGAYKRELPYTVIT